MRDRTEADLERCLELARVVKDHDDYPPRGSVDGDWFLAPDEQLAAWVAEEGDSVVGHVALHAAPDYVSTRLASEVLGRPRSELGIIARLFVDPARRGSGAGHALLARATAAAVERSRYPVLDVATHLTSAIALYEATGWQRVGEVDFDTWGEQRVEPPLPLYVYIFPAS